MGVRFKGKILPYGRMNAGQGQSGGVEYVVKDSSDNWNTGSYPSVAKISTNRWEGIRFSPKISGDMQIKFRIDRVVSNASYPPSNFYIGMSLGALPGYLVQKPGDFGWYSRTGAINGHGNYTDFVPLEAGQEWTMYWLSETKTLGIIDGAGNDMSWVIPDGIYFDGEEYYFTICCYDDDAFTVLNL